MMVLGVALVVWLVPVLPTDAHRLDLVGGLSGVGMFLLVFGLREGQPAHWRPWIWDRRRPRVCVRVW